MKQKNVELVTYGVKDLTKDGIVSTEDTFKPDVLIYATGFCASDFLKPLSSVIMGKGGVTLKDSWNGRPRAWFGITVPNFPNFGMLYGPNTNLSHSSIVTMMEC
jgi:cation diffusion facilitator CzcD-associated flavoprotein CzcO